MAFENLGLVNENLVFVTHMQAHGFSRLTMGLPLHDVLNTSFSLPSMENYETSSSFRTLFFISPILPIPPP